MMPVLAPAKRLLLGAALLLPGVLLVAFAVAPLLDGISTDSAIPVQIYLTRQQALPTSSYRRAASELLEADSRNGISKVFAAEAALASGASPTSQVPSLIEGLARAPANARGWMVLSDAYATSDPQEAADALEQSFLLAPYDYWLAGPRAVRAAKLWSSIGADNKADALRQVLMLWEEPVLRPQMHLVLRTPAGVELVRRAFDGRQDELRGLNRWLSQQRRHQDRP